MDILLGMHGELPMEAARIAIALAGVLVGTYFDLFNKKNVPEIFLYAFLAIAFLFNLYAYGPAISIYAIASALLVFAAFYLLYKFGQLGGADVYIMSSLALLLPVQPKLLLAYPQPQFATLPFILNLILASGISFMIYMLLRSLPIAYNYLKNPKELGKGQLFGSFAIVIAFAAFSFVAMQMPFISSSYYVFLAVMVILSVYFTLFKPAINESMVSWVSGKGVEAEDIIATDMMDKELVKNYSLGRLVTPEQLERMQKIKSKKIALYKKLPPFIPHILIGLIASLFLGNIVLFFAGLF